MLILVLVSSVGCDTSVDEKSVVISGLVRSAATQVPVDSAWIALADSVGGIRTETDELGEFSFTAPPWSEHRLIVGATGFLTNDTTIYKAEDDIENTVVELTPSP